MPDYNMDEIIEEWKKKGRPAHSAFHNEKQKEAKQKGETFPAYTTFRKALVREGLLPDKKSSSKSEASSIGIPAIDPEVKAFLEDVLPDSIAQDLENSFLRWKNKRLEDELNRLKRERLPEREERE